MSRRNLPRAATSIVFVLCFFVVAGIRLGLAENSEGEGLAVTVMTDQFEYNYGIQVIVEGAVYNTSTGEPVAAKVLIEVFKEDTALYRVSTMASENGTYFDKGYYASEIGVLSITSNASSRGYNGTASTRVVSVSIGSVEELLTAYAIPASVLTASVSYFILLLIVTRSSHQRRKADLPLEAYWGKLFGPTLLVAIEFFVLTTFTVCVIVALAFTPRSIGDGPLGLVLNTYGNETQWVVNLGGTRVVGTSQYLGGVQVPIYVIGLSFIGAYVYFLSKVPELIKSKNQQELRDDALVYLVRFFISPLLAVALYLVLWQADVRGHFTLAVVSFTVGLIIEDVNLRIIEFSKDLIGKFETPEGRIRKKIEALKDLHEKEMLTDEEFKSKKEELLNKL